MVCGGGRGVRGRRLNLPRAFPAAGAVKAELVGRQSAEPAALSLVTDDLPFAMLRVSAGLPCGAPPALACRQAQFLRRRNGLCLSPPLAVCFGVKSRDTNFNKPGTFCLLLF
jgi:hypothetical protein